MSLSTASQLDCLLHFNCLYKRERAGLRAIKFDLSRDFGRNRELWRVFLLYASTSRAIIKSRRFGRNCERWASSVLLYMPWLRAIKFDWSRKILDKNLASLSLTSPTSLSIQYLLTCLTRLTKFVWVSIAKSSNVRCYSLDKISNLGMLHVRILALCYL